MTNEEHNDATQGEQTPTQAPGDDQATDQVEAQTEGTPSEETPAEQTPAKEAPETKKDTNDTPAGTTTPGALFDMSPVKPETAKEKPKAAAASATASVGAKTPTRYEEGTEVRYGREKLTLPKEMTAKDVLDWMSDDDYPELKYEEARVEYDKDKKRLVVVRKAQTKSAGECAGLAAETDAGADAQ